MFKINKPVDKGRNKYRRNKPATKKQLSLAICCEKNEGSLAPKTPIPAGVVRWYRYNHIWCKKKKGGGKNLHLLILARRSPLLKNFNIGTIFWHLPVKNDGRLDLYRRIPPTAKSSILMATFRLLEGEELFGILTKARPSSTDILCHYFDGSPS